MLQSLGSPSAKIGIVVGRAMERRMRRRIWRLEPRHRAIVRARATEEIRRVRLLADRGMLDLLLGCIVESSEGVTIFRETRSAKGMMYVATVLASVSMQIQSGRRPEDTTCIVTARRMRAGTAVRVAMVIDRDAEVMMK